MPASKPRIGLFVHCFPPALGGLEYFAGELKSALEDHFQTLVITGKGKTLDSYKTFSHWVDSSEDESKTIYRLPLQQETQRWANRLLGKTLRLFPWWSHIYFGPILAYTPTIEKEIAQSDCIIAMGMPTNSFVEAARFAELNNKPLIAVPAYHDVSYFNNNPVFSKVLKQAVKILCLSPYEERSLHKEYPVTKGKTTIIAFSPFPVSQLQQNEQKTPPEKTVTVGFIGQISQRKRLHIFPALLHQLNEVLGTRWKLRAVLAGAKTNESPLLEKELHEEMQNGTISIQYNFPNKGKVYEQLDIFINPSEEESLGIVNLEAMQAGIPVFSSKRSPFAEMAPITSFQDTNDLAEKIAIILSDKACWEDHLAKQHSFLRTRSREQFTHQVTDIIHQVMSGTM